jgi:murein DD-endopeptidase MepM/ murein hydrolase activator NlpD
VIDDLYLYGNMVIIETAYDRIPVTAREVIHVNENESLYILYAHLDQAPLVRLGDQVDACQLLGEVGKSGNADIPHLHLETRLGPPGTVFVSMRFYDTRASVEEMENYKLWRTSGVYRHFDPMQILSP